MTRHQARKKTKHLHKIDLQFLTMVKIYLEKAPVLHSEVAAIIFDCFQVLQSFYRTFEASWTVDKVFGGKPCQQENEKKRLFVQRFIGKCCQPVNQSEESKEEEGAAEREREEMMTMEGIQQEVSILNRIKWVLKKLGVSPAFVLVACVTRLGRLLSNFREKVNQMKPLMEVPWLGTCLKCALESVFEDGDCITEGYQSLFFKEPEWKASVFKFFMEQVVPTRAVSQDVFDVFDPFSFLGKMLSEKVLLVLALQGDVDSSSFEVDPLLTELVQRATAQVSGEPENWIHTLFCAVLSALEGRTSSSDRSVNAWVSLVENLLKSGLKFQGNLCFEVVLAVVLFHGPGWSFTSKHIFHSFSNPGAVDRNSGAVLHTMLLVTVLEHLSDQALKTLEAWLGFGFLIIPGYFRRLLLPKVLLGSDPSSFSRSTSSSVMDPAVLYGNGRFRVTFKAVFQKLKFASGEGKKWAQLLSNVELSHLPSRTIGRLLHHLPHVFFSFLSMPQAWSHLPEVLRNFRNGLVMWETFFPEHKSCFIQFNQNVSPPSFPVDQAANVFLHLFGDTQRLYKFFLGLTGSPSEGFGVLPKVLQHEVMDYYVNLDDQHCGRLNVLFILAAVVSTGSSNPPSKKRKAATALGRSGPPEKLLKFSEE
mmetsp:Transcript_25939/g.36742  ORF Transcript_25939/g.36742 Transcript_25939/m.36742 type:complete len:645 (-) Transcript_25939:28-1962(-)